MSPGADDPLLARWRHGTPQAVRAPGRCTAGALSCLFEHGAVRQLCWQGQEVLRGVAYLLRDTDWGTAGAEVLDLAAQQSPDRFVLQFALHLGLAEGVLRARARIEGSATGHFSFEVEATPQAPLRSNRCGFVVLHPAAAAGAPLVVEHTDGSTRLTHFPTLISPVQPVLNIRRLRHTPQAGLEVDCRLDADLPGRPQAPFEMEDQRNWSDASFKTYVGSLLDPWPYTLAAGQGLRQSVHVQVHDHRSGVGTPTATAAQARTPPSALRLGPLTETRLPAIGLGVPAEAHRLVGEERHAIEVLRPAWLVAEADLDLDLDPTHGTAALRRQLQAIQALSAACGAQVQLDLLCPSALSPAEAAASAAAACAAAGLQPAAVRACPSAYLRSYQPQDRWPDLPGSPHYAEAFGRAFPHSRIGGGVLTYFTELNRLRPSAQGLHFIGHTSCPIVHAADDRAVVETLETLPHIARSVAALWPGLGYRLGPLTLAMHRNPYGAAPAPNPRHERLPMASTDPRHQAAFGAAWLVGVAAALAPYGLELLSLHHSHGASGPLLWPGQPGYLPGACVPAWGVQQLLARASGARLQALTGLPEGLAGLAWRHDGGAPQGLLANLGEQPLALQLPGRWSARECGHACRPDAPATTPWRCSGEQVIEPCQVWSLEAA